MEIIDEPDLMRIVIEARDRVMWLEGSKLFYKMPKDERPDINPYDLEDSLQPYYALYKLVKERYDLNQVPPELVDALEKMNQLANIFNAYTDHVLGLICKPRYLKARQ